MSWLNTVERDLSSMGSCWDDIPAAYQLLRLGVANDEHYVHVAL